MPKRTEQGREEDRTPDEELPLTDDGLAELAEEFLDRLHSGESPDREVFLSSYPEVADKLRDRIDLLEGLYRSQGRSEDPRSASSLTEDLHSTQATHDRVGPYRILRKIGGGGMGIVYLAEQTGPVRRKVALKMIRKDMDTGDVLARFDTERQALGLMDHPGIARVFDAGSDATDRPYFVMEHVAGEPLTSYCDRNRMNPTERLGLFRQVCDAVQHAHQKGIIHRDLKPSNVLVTVMDGTPAPKIIDFGIAKAVVGKLTDDALCTEYGQIIGTPEYMSPEQAAGNSIDVDTRTDVYSLGVILYELLTGTPPFSSDELRSAGLDESRRRIREDEPPKPSTRVSTLGRTALALAHKRHTEPKKLSRLLRGDLDWITMKALEKDRNRRYATALELDEEIRRHLSHEPVQAGPPSGLYRIRKFVRKHRIGVAACLAVALSLLGGLTASIVLYSRAEREAGQAIEDRLAAEQARTEEMRQRRAAESAQALAEEKQELAEQEAEKAKAISHALGRVLSSFSPRTMGGEVRFVDVLDRAVEDLDSSSFEDGEIEASLRKRIGEAYRDLGLVKKALPQIRRALELYIGTVGEEDAITLRCKVSLAGVLESRSEFEEAEAVCLEALQTLRSVHGDGDPATRTARNELGTILYAQGRYEESYDIFSDLLEYYRSVYEEDNEWTLLALLNMGFALSGLGRTEEEKRVLEEALEGYRSALGDEHPLTILCISTLGHVLTQLGECGKAEALLQEALEISRRVHGEEHPRTIQCQEGIAGLRQLQSRWDEAERLYRASWEMRVRHQGGDQDSTYWTAYLLGGVLHSKGELEEARSFHQRAVDGLSQLLGEDNKRTMLARLGLAVVLGALGEHDAGEKGLKELLADQQRVLGHGHHDSVQTVVWLVEFLLKRERPDDAERLCRGTIERLGETLSADDRLVLWLQEKLSHVYHNREDIPGSERIAREVLRRRRETLGDSHPETIESVSYVAHLIGFIHGGNKRLAEAEKLHREAFATAQSILGEDAGPTLSYSSSLGLCLLKQGKHEAAEPVWRKTLVKHERVFGETDRRTLNCLNNLALSLSRQGKLAEAEPFMLRSVEIKRRELGPEDRDTIKSTANLSSILMRMNRLEEAEELGRMALQTSLAAFGEDARETASATLILANIIESQGKLDEAERLARQALARWSKLDGPDGTHTIGAARNLGLILLAQGKLDEAEPLIREAFQRFRSRWGDKHILTLTGMTALGELLAGQRKLGEALRLQRRIVALADKTLSRRQPLRWRSHLNYGSTLLKLERYDDAETHLTRGHEALRDFIGPEHRFTTGAIRLLVDLYTAWGKPEKAAEYQALLEPSEDRAEKEQPEESGAPTSK